MEAARGCWQWLNAQHRRSLIILPGRWHPESRRRGDLTAGSGTRYRCERCQIEATRGSADLEVRGSGSDAAPVRASSEILRAKSDGACADAGDGERNEPGQLVALRPHGREPRQSSTSRDGWRQRGAGVRAGPSVPSGVKRPAPAPGGHVTLPRHHHIALDPHAGKYDQSLLQHARAAWRRWQQNTWSSLGAGAPAAQPPDRALSRRAAGRGAGQGAWRRCVDGGKAPAAAIDSTHPTVHDWPVTTHQRRSYRCAWPHEVRVRQGPRCVLRAEEQPISPRDPGLRALGRPACGIALSHCLSFRSYRMYVGTEDTTATTAPAAAATPRHGHGLDLPASAAAARGHGALAAMHPLNRAAPPNTYMCSQASRPGEHSDQEAGGRPTEARANLGPKRSPPARRWFIISRGSCWRAAFPLPAADAAAATSPAHNLPQETLQSSLRPTCKPVCLLPPGLSPDKRCLCAGAQTVRASPGPLRRPAPIAG
ncbi:hypothetical protein CCMA1212_008058 [Trichoderma ghanense]|uniref:Uncharacterized protein n=1 Tax=Trichoderma ghanense TaxID=65468 RepID=A0ABY2GX24_9HYPO